MLDKKTKGLLLYNSLSGKKEEFRSIKENQVKMYVCGPTVYDYMHIGNARAMLVFDILYRLLIDRYGKQNVTYIRNITDVDDKINDRAKNLNISIYQLTQENIQYFQQDLEYLQCLPPTFEPKATDHITHMISFISELIDKKHAYITSNGVYFDVSSYPSYYELSRRIKDKAQNTKPKEQHNAKLNIEDFALWKPATKHCHLSSIFESPWGMGRPGWHIECSAMSKHFLGDHFDIHGGGIDLIFPHHTNEIAQSESLSGSKYANYWVHNGPVTVEGTKMSKSLGNFTTVQNLYKESHIEGETLRFALLDKHYRKPLDFNHKNLSDAKAQLDYLYRTISKATTKVKTKVPERFIEILSHDLDTHGALTYIMQLAKKANAQIEWQGSESINTETAISQIIVSANMLGLLQQTSNQWFSCNADKVDKTEIEQLLLQRAQAKKTKNWVEADRIRNLLSKRGIVLEDKPDGSTSWYKGAVAR